MLGISSFCNTYGHGVLAPLRFYVFSIPSLVDRSFPMQRITLTLFSCSLFFASTGLQAQELDSNDVKELVEQAADVEQGS